MLTALVVASLLLPQEQPRELLVGKVLEGRITDGDPVCEHYAGQVPIPPLARRFSLRVPTSGTYRIELRSRLFDAFLLLRGPDGEIVAEEADGAAPHARIVAQLDSKTPYFVDAGAWSGERGPFTLQVLAGAGDRKDSRAQRRRHLEEWRAIVQARTEAYGRAHVDVGRALRHLGVAVARSGDLAGAEPLFREAVEIATAACGEDDARTARAWRDLGVLHWHRGSYDAALAAHRHAVAIEERAPNRTDVSLADSLADLANALSALGRLAEEETVLRRALALTEQSFGADHVETSGRLHNLAVLLRRQGRLDEAERMYRRALAIRETAHGGEHRHVINTRANLAKLLLYRGSLDEAHALARKAVESSDRVFGANNFRTARVLEVLGQILIKQGDATQSRGILQRVLHLRRQQLGEHHPDTLSTLVDLATAHEADGDHEAARTLYEQVFRARRSLLGASHRATIDAANRIARSYTVSGNHAAAFDWQARALELAFESTTRQLLLSGIEDRYRYAALIKDSIDRLLTSATHLDSDVDGRCHAYLSKWKGIVFRNTRRLRSHFTSALSGAQRAQIGRLRDLERQMSAISFARKVTDEDAHARRLNELREQRDLAEAELALALDLDVRADDFTSSRLAARLPAGAALIDFYVHRPAQVAHAGNEAPPPLERVSAWILAAGTTDIERIDLGPAVDLRTSIEAFLETMRTRRGRPPRGADSAASRLRERLWKPLALTLADATTIFIVPDGFLGRLPFETVPLADGSFLIEHAKLVYLTDVGALPSTGKARGEEGTRSLLAIGDVDYEERAPATGSRQRGGFERTWVPLPGTATEIRALEALHRRLLAEQTPRELLTGDRATEGRFKATAGSFDVVHLATHGFFEPAGIPSLWESAQAGTLVGRPPELMSGLILSGANLDPEPDGDDGVLTAAEIASLDLSTCSLAVLSACETGLGTARGGEGMASVRRAFHQAGVDTVISSLWTVDDEATRTLMIEFYRRLWEDKQSPVDALRGAQLWMLARNRARDARRPQPAHWGAFVLSGAPE